MVNAWWLLAAFVLGAYVSSRFTLFMVNRKIEEAMALRKRP